MSDILEPDPRPDATEQCLDVTAAVAALRREPPPEGGGPRRKVLYRRGPVTLLLLAFETGAFLPEHTARGLVTLHLLDGALTVRTPDQCFALAPGRVLALASYVRHAVTAEEPSALLLTLHAERFADVGL